MANVRFDGDGPGDGVTTNLTQKKGRNNKEIVKEINEPAKPNAGARLAPGKDPLNCDDSLGQTEDGRKIVKHDVQVVFDAKETRKGVDDPKEQSQRRSANFQVPDSAIPVVPGRHKGNPENVDEN